MLAMDVWCFSKSTIRVDLEKHQTRLHYWGNSLCNFEEAPLQFWVFLLCTKHLEAPRPKQDVVPIDIVPDHIPEQHTASQMQNMYLDKSHTIEVAMKDITVRISNDADPVLLTRTFRLLQELSC